MAGTLAALGALLVLVFAALPALAQDGTVVTFTVRAERTLVRDRLAAELAVEASDSNPARVQDEINRRMAAALARAKAVAGVTVETGGYNVFEERPDKAPLRWRGRQTVRLEGQDKTALLTLVGVLQSDGLALVDLSAALSRDAARAVEDELTNEALRRATERAQKIATSLGLKLGRIRTLQVGSVAAPPVAMPRMMAMSLAAAPPVAEAGTATVAVTVSAEVELVPMP